MGAGGYHHHLGTNTWAGPSAHPPAEDQAQLLEWTIELPAADDVAQLAQRLHSAPSGARVDRDVRHNHVHLTDPWGTLVAIVAG
jgi:catechol 2,3-dioxygenase